MLRKEYIDLCDQLNKKENVIFIDPESTPRHVINQTLTSISLPYTDTATIAQLKKKSAYFDSTCLLNQNHPKSHGIEVINEQKVLDK